MTEDIITVDNLCYSVHGSKLILDNISLSVPRGSFVAVLGENGAGRSGVWWTLFVSRIALR